MKAIEINSKQFQNVLKKAIEVKPLVRLGKKQGEYFVAASSSDVPYAVNFQRAAGGRMLGSCLCAGGQHGFHCYHLAAALIVHSSFVRAGLRKPAPTRAEIQAARFPHLVYAGSEAMRALI